MKRILSLCVVFALLLAGCAANDVDPEAGENGGNGDAAAPADGGGDGDASDEDGSDRTGSTLRLTDLECSYKYPDNETDVPCSNGFTEVEASSTEPPSFLDTQWLCVHQEEHDNVDYSLHWHPLEGVHGLYYETEVDEQINGVLYTTSDGTADGEIFVSWFNQGSSGFIELPLLAEGVDARGFALRVYTHTYNSTTPELEGGTIQAYWSFYEDKSYPLQVVKADAGSYYFNAVRSGGGNFPYTLDPFQLEGQDFEIDVQAQHLLDYQDAFTNYPLHQCTL